MKRIQRLANQYIEEATASFNRDRQVIPAEMRLANFVIAHKITSADHAAIYQWLIGQGVL